MNGTDDTGGSAPSGLVALGARLTGLDPSPTVGRLLIVVLLIITIGLAQTVLAAVSLDGVDHWLAVAGLLVAAVALDAKPFRSADGSMVFSIVTPLAVCAAWLNPALTLVGYPLAILTADLAVTISPLARVPDRGRVTRAMTNAGLVAVGLGVAVATCGLLDGGEGTVTVATLLRVAAAAIVADLVSLAGGELLNTLASGAAVDLRETWRRAVPPVFLAPAAPLLVATAAVSSWALLLLSPLVPVYVRVAGRLHTLFASLIVDPGTGLLSRSGLVAWASRRPEATRAVMVVRIRGYDRLQQALGQQASDRVMTEVGSRLVQMLPGREIARVAPDHYGIAGDSPGFVQKPPEDIIAATEGTYDVDGVPIVIRLDAGMAQSTSEDPCDGEELLLRAESAVGHGPGAVTLHSEEVRRASVTDLRTAAHLLDALDDDGDTSIQAAFQPIMGSLTDVVGVEALARWTTPDGNNVPPPVFIDALEQMGLTHRLTDVMLDRACQAIASWADADIHLQVNVNLTPADLVRDDIVTTIAATARRHGVDPALLTVEMTEQAATIDPTTTRATLTAIRGLGCSTAVDDFGVGYSSIGRLADFPFEQVKLDRVLVTDIHLLDQRQTVVANLVRLVHDLGMTVTAEGVESLDEAQVLAALGVDKLQGWAFGRPVPAEEILGTLQRARQ